jgi:hypothetical protein
LPQPLVALQGFELEAALGRERAGAERLERLLELQRERIRLLLAQQLSLRRRVAGDCDPRGREQAH